MTSSSSTISPATRPRRDQTGGSRRRRPTVVPAGLFTGPQPHRAGLRQDQALDAQRPKTKHRRHVASSRTPHRHHRAQRVPELHPKRRIWFQLKRMRSRVRPMISAICSSPNLARSPGARFIVKAVEPALGKALTPPADRIRVASHPLHDRLVLKPLGCRQNNPRPPRQSLGRIPSAGEAFQLSPLHIRQGDRYRCSAYQSSLQHNL